MLEPFSVPLIDVRGKLRRIRGLPLCDRRWFLSLRAEALVLAADSDFRTLYDDSDSPFRAIVDECLLMNGISPSWVDAQMTLRLLFGVGDEPSILLILNFPEEAESEDDDAAELPANIDPSAYGLAALWSHTTDLEQALRVAEQQPWNEIHALLKARNHQLKELESRAKGKKPMSAAERKKTEEKLNRMMESGSLQKLIYERHHNPSDSRPQYQEVSDDIL